MKKLAYDLKVRESLENRELNENYSAYDKTQMWSPVFFFLSSTKPLGFPLPSPFWAADPKGTMSYRTEGGISVRPSVRPSERTNVHTNQMSVLSPEGLSPPPQPLGPLQAPAPQALRDPPQAPAPLLQASSHPPSPSQALSSLREPLLPTDGRIFPHSTGHSL